MCIDTVALNPHLFSDLVSLVSRREGGGEGGVDIRNFFTISHDFRNFTQFFSFSTIFPHELETEGEMSFLACWHTLGGGGNSTIRWTVSVPVRIKGPLPTLHPGLWHMCRREFLSKTKKAAASHKAFPDP